MAENLLQKLEEKMMVLLAELEDLRKESQLLRQENSSLKAQQEIIEKKLEGIVSLLDTVSITDNATQNQTYVAAVKPVLMELQA